MIEHKLLWVSWINEAIKSILSLVGIHLQADQEPIPQYIMLALVTTLLILIFFRLATRVIRFFPSPMQSFLEMVYKFFRNLIDDAIGPEGRQFLPALGTIGIFIAMSNLIGLFPELGSPTANLNVTAGCALFTFVYYHVQGVRRHGAMGYLKHFLGPAWWLSWLFFPIEVVSHFSRLLSLSMRLFGNIFGEDLVIIIVASISPIYLFFSPLPMMAMAVFTSLLQAFIFVMLSSIYLAGAMESEH